MIEIRTIKNTNIQYLLDKGSRKNSYIQIKDGNVIVKTSNSATEKYINQFLEEKIDWIEKKLKEYSNFNRNYTYENGSKILLLGKELTLLLIEDSERKRIYIENASKNLIIYVTVEFKKLTSQEQKETIKSLINKYYKSIAKEEVFPAMEDITSRVGLVPKEVKIKNLKATWGICSSKKTISINQNLMMFSRHAIEYVCLHEVCHLKHMNHSKKFWDMVEYYMPDYKTAKAELKQK